MHTRAGMISYGVSEVDREIGQYIEMTFRLTTSLPRIGQAQLPRTGSWGRFECAGCLPLLLHRRAGW